jgi:hypothetical protein
MNPSTSALYGRARRRGYMLKKSRGGWNLDNQGGFMLVDDSSGGVVTGSMFDLTADDVREYLDEVDRNDAEASTGT